MKMSSIRLQPSWPNLISATMIPLNVSAKNANVEDICANFMSLSQTYPRLPSIRKVSTIKKEFKGLLFLPKSTTASRDLISTWTLPIFRASVAKVEINSRDLIQKICYIATDHHQIWHLIQLNFLDIKVITNMSSPLTSTQEATSL